MTSSRIVRYLTYSFTVTKLLYIRIYCVERSVTDLVS